MKLASLYSGGKDSAFSTYKVLQEGYQVACLVSIRPIHDDSLLFHYPNSWITDKISDAMQIPCISNLSAGRSKEQEQDALEQAIEKAMSNFGIEGIVHGGISSKFQKDSFEKVCSKRGIKAISPLWGIEPLEYMRSLVEEGFKVLIVGVSAFGLDDRWLGRVLDGKAIEELNHLHKKYGLNLCFEGGEAETLVLDCPIYMKRIEIQSYKIHWDGQRGIFEILDVSLISK